MKDRKTKKLWIWLLRVLLAIVVLLLLLFAGSNLFLSSSSGQKFLQKKLNQRTIGLQWDVSGASWSPWRGITIRKLSAKLRPSSNIPPGEHPPFFSLREAELKPYWGQLIRGKKLFREVIVDEPVLNVPLESLFALNPQQTAPTLSTEATPLPKPIAPKSIGEKTPSKKPPAEKKAHPSKPAPRKNSVKKQPNTQPTIPDEKRFWLRLRRAKVRIYSTKSNQPFLIDNLELDLPLSGPATKGQISWKNVSFDGKTLLEKTTLPIQWKHPGWELPNQKLTLLLPHYFEVDAKPTPLKFNLGGSLGFRAKGQPFKLTLALPQQPFPDYVIHRESHFHLRSKSLATGLAINGSLPRVDTWRMRSSFAMSDIEVFSELREQHFTFDSAQAQITLRNSILNAPKVSLRSEELSLLGNGQLSLNGYILGVMRIICAPELRYKFQEVAIGSHLSIGWTGHWFSPLDTPDRFYRDLHMEGPLPNAQINTGRRGEFLPLPTIIKRLRTFTSVEVAEELPSSP